jgi:transmembrane sensor
MVRTVIPFGTPDPERPSDDERSEALRFVEALAETGATDDATSETAAETAETWALLGLLSPEDVAALKSEPKTPDLWRSPAVWGGAIAACLVLSIGGAWFAGRPFVYETGIGEIRTVSLSDGSQVTLNTQSRLEAKINNDHRHVRLTRGEAYFAVAKRPDHAAFEVATDNAVVRVTGTHFNVDLHRGRTDVDLIEGRVEVAPKAVFGANPTKVALSPGEAVQVSASGDVRRNSASSARIDDWLHRRLTFADSPLGEAVAEMNRYSPRPIRLEGAQLPQMKINGVFEAGDTVTFTKALSALYDLKVGTADNEITVSMRSRLAKQPPA